MVGNRLLVNWRPLRTKSDPFMISSRRTYCLVAWAVLAGAACSQTAAAMAAKSAWQPSAEFPEVWLTREVAPDVRVHVNAPKDKTGEPVRGTRLLVFATPNGNTIEQTLGSKMAEGLDWHYDIQHVAAQVRLLRTLFPDERIVLIVVEAKGLSWPNWRRTHENANATIAKLVDGWRTEFGTEDAKVTLTGHSGGGAFEYGVIEGQDEIPDTIDRIAYLDSDYWFEGADHAEKFNRWLERDPAHRLVVICYDDRNITVDGKKVVSDTGGTFRAAGRMRDALGKLFPISASKQPPFDKYTDLDGRFQMFVHPNPENKILHTVLVGEMNGLVEAATVGTPQEDKWGTFGGPRAYTKWAQAKPTPDPNTPPAAPTNSQPSEKRTSASPELPPRPSGAMGGKEFVRSVDGLTLAEREAAILREISGGNFPNFLRQFKTVPIHGTAADGNELATTLLVMPDYLAIGSDDDFVRMPMTPQTAQQIAERFACTLPTPKMVDAIDAQAEVQLEPRPLTVDREAVKTFAEHNAIIESQRAGKPLGLLVTGIKKDIVLSLRIFERPERLAIYGWRQLDGRPIQDLTIVHWDKYVDYSHGVRLVRNQVTLDGQMVAITDVLRDPNRSALVSDEGPMDPPRYPSRN